MSLYIYENKEELTEQLAKWMCETIESTLQNQEFFTIALSGGNTPHALYKKLASAEFREKIEWKRVHIFWGDERVVSFNDKRNNAGTAYEMLIDHIHIPAAQVHKMRTDIEPVFAEKEYEKILQNYFNNTVKSFDLVLLGVGDDGHTLSIFPASPLVENEEHKWVHAIYNKEQQMFRITLTPEIVNRASYIAFIVTGANKANMLKQVIEGDYIPSLLPAQLINPKRGELLWFLDQAAAEHLKK